MRGSNYSDSTGEILVFWKSGRCGRLQEVVTRGGLTAVHVFLSFPLCAQFLSLFKWFAAFHTPIALWYSALKS